MAAEFGARLESVRSTVPLVHCITNYVTVHDVANVLIACGGSPIMSDEPADVADITSICGALYVNIGTLNARTIEGMEVAAARALRAWRETDAGEGRDPVAAARLDLRAQTTFESLADGLALGGRAIVRVARVARTIADIEHRERVSEDDVVEALGFRSRALT